MMITTEDIEFLESLGEFRCDYKGRPNRRIDAPSDYESARKEFYAHLSDNARIVILVADEKTLAYISGDGKERVHDAASRLPYIHSEN